MRWLIVFLLVALPLGCKSVTKAVDDFVAQFQAQHPGVAIQGKDEDGDGVTDFFVATIDGKEVEVDGSRDMMSQYKQADMSLAEIIGIATGLLGVGGGAGAWVGRKKPLARTAASYALIRNMIANIKAGKPNEAVAEAESSIPSPQPKETPESA